MAQEMLLTYSTHGIRPETSGFCTVAVTDGTPSPIVDSLELLSGYEMAYPQSDPRFEKNPALLAHYLPTQGVYKRHFLTSVRLTDNSCPGSRPNKLARHLVVDDTEELAPGPAWVLRHSAVMDKPWDGVVRVLPEPTQIPTGNNPARFCEAWKEAAGDAGWAGVLVEQFLLDASKPGYVIYKPEHDAMALIDEALALMPQEDRWRVSFSTYFTRPIPGVQCCWRFVLDGTATAQKVREVNRQGFLVIDLTSPELGQAPRGKYVELARNSPVINTRQVRANEKNRSEEDGWSDVNPQKQAQLQAQLQAQAQAEFDAQAAAIPRAAAPAPQKAGAGWLFWTVAIVWPVLAGVLTYNRVSHVREAELAEAQSQIAGLKAKAEEAALELAQARTDANMLAQQLANRNRSSTDTPPPADAAANTSANTASDQPTTGNAATGQEGNR